MADELRKVAILAGVIGVTIYLLGRLHRLWARPPAERAVDDYSADFAAIHTRFADLERDVRDRLDELAGKLGEPSQEF